MGFGSLMRRRTLYANDRMAEILGTTVADLTGKPSFEYVFPTDVVRHRRIANCCRCPGYRCMGLAGSSSESSARSAWSNLLLSGDSKQLAVANIFELLCTVACSIYEYKRTLGRLQ